MKTIIYLILILISYSANSQSLHIFDIDTTDFPTMRAKFWAFDEEGKQITNLSPSDFELTENGEIRTITDVSCSDNLPERLSIVLLVDISRYNDIKYTKSVLNSWLDLLDLGKNEVSLVTYDGLGYINQDFTTNKSILQSKINSLNSISSKEDHSGALLRSYTGGISVAEKGKYRKIIVFLSSCSHFKQSSTKDIIEMAKNSFVSLNFLIFDVSDWTPELTQLMANETYGLSKNNIPKNDLSKAKLALSDILHNVKGNNCLIDWESLKSCKYEIRNIELKFKKNEISSTSIYQYPYSKLVKLEFKPPFIRFQDPTIGTNFSEQIKITAKNNTFNVNDITSSNPKFSISPTNFTLTQNESIDLTLSYTAQDSGYNFSEFNFKNDFCEQIYFASGSYQSKKPKISTLKLNHPNGGEEFAVGSDVTITWDGITPFDTLRLEYSSNNGETWKNITNKATDLKYIWKNVQSPASSQYLINIYQDELVNNPAHKIQWQKTFGGSRNEYIKQVKELSDLSIAIIGNTNSNDGDFLNSYADEYYQDLFVVKLNHIDGTIHWKKTFGGSSRDGANTMLETKIGTLIVGAQSQSNDGTLPGNNGDWDFWILNLNPNDGSVIWQKTFGGTGNEGVRTITELDNGNLIIVGESKSNNGDAIGHIGELDFWVLCLNQNDGNILWQKFYGDKMHDKPKFVFKSNNGTLIIAGETNDYSNVSNFLILKINSIDGSILWQNIIGGSNHDNLTSMIETNNGDFVLTGFTESKNRDDPEYEVLYDIYVVKINSIDGSIIWQKTFGGNKNDVPSSIIETSDGNFVIAGFTESNNKDISENKGLKDYWVLKLNQLDGSLIWQKTFGGSHDDIAESIIESNDGTLIVTGSTRSNDGDLIGNNNEINIWVLNLKPSDGSLIWDKKIGGSKNDFPHSSLNTSDGTHIVVGRTSSYDGDFTENKGGYDICVVKLVEPIPLQKDKSDNVFSIVETDGIAIDIDMGQLFIKDTKDSVVNEFVQNIGNYPFAVISIYFRGADAKAFSFISDLNENIIQPNESHFGEFRFTPNRVGLHNAEVVVITQSDTLIQSIVGEGIERNIAVIEDFIDFGQVYVGDIKDTLQVVTIKNVGSTPFSINETKHSYPNDIDFTTLVGGGNFTLQPGETHQMSLRFSPSDVGRTSGVLEFHYDGVGNPEVIQLFGEGIQKDSLPEINPLPDVISIKSISPNPATNNLEIILNLIEKGKTELAIYNTNGIKVKSIFNENITEFGEKIYNVSTSTLSGGKYFVVLITPTYSEKKNLVIVR